MTYLVSNLSLTKDTITPLPQFQNLWSVGNNNNRTTLIENTCAHRGALMVNKTQEFNGLLVCPFHRWTYDRDGKLVGKQFADGCIKTEDITVWNNLLFSNKFKGIELPEPFASELSLDNYTHTKTEIMTVKSSWQIFMEVYVDLYHVKPFHEGLGNFVDMANYKWHFGQGWSLQEVPITPRLGKNPNPKLRKLEEHISSNYKDVTYGALWLSIYPNIMLEWYPNTIVVSTIWPGLTEGESINVIEYHHKEEVSAFDPEFVQTQIDAYNITALEDAELCERIQAGRKKPAYQHPFHPELELGIQHFYDSLSEKNYCANLKIG